jgi:predicted  nucleic acid-binding Zn-ribbon protein
LEQQIETAGTENKTFKNQIKDLKKKIKQQQEEINDEKKVQENDRKTINELNDNLDKEKELRKRENER